MKFVYSDYVKVNDDIWFYPLNFNALFRYNLSQHQLFFIGMVEDEAYDAKYLFHKLVYSNSTLWLIPYQAKRLYSYKIDDNMFESFPLPDGIDINVGCRFLGGEILGNRLLLIPFACRSFLEFDLDRRRFVDDSCFNILMNTDDSINFFRGLRIYEDRLFFGYFSRNMLGSINLNGQELKHYEIDDSFCGVVNILVDSDGVIVIGNSGKVGWYDLDYNLISSFSPLDNDAYQRYTDFAKKNEYIYISDSNQPRIVALNIMDGKTQSIPYGTTSLKLLEDIGNTGFIKNINGKIVFQSLFDSVWYECDKGGISPIFFMESEISAEDMKRIYSSMQHPVVESNNFTLCRFINLAVN